MTVKELIGHFQRMHREKWQYVWGAARRGCVDCSGAFVYVYGLYGMRMGIHGSNYMARKEVGEMLPISEARPGMAAFRCRKPGDSRYSIPGRYRPGGAYYNGDVNDYYHVGLVDEDTGYVLNAQGTKSGFVRSPITANWYGVARLNRVEEAQTESMESTEIKATKATRATKEMTVTAANGLPVRVRKKPGKSAAVLGRAKVGTPVEVVETRSDGWSEILWNGQTGYMQTGFLTESEGELLAALAEALCAVEKALQAAKGGEA